MIKSYLSAGDAIGNRSSKSANERRIFCSAKDRFVNLVLVVTVKVTVAKREVVVEVMVEVEIAGAVKVLVEVLVVVLVAVLVLKLVEVYSVIVEVGPAVVVDVIVDVIVIVEDGGEKRDENKVRIPGCRDSRTGTRLGAAVSGYRIKG